MILAVLGILVPAQFIVKHFLPLQQEVHREAFPATARRSTW